MSGLGVDVTGSEKWPGQDGFSSGGERESSGAVSRGVTGLGFSSESAHLLLGEQLGSRAEAGPSWGLGLGLGPGQQSGGLQWLGSRCGWEEAGGSLMSGARGMGGESGCCWGLAERSGQGGIGVGRQDRKGMVSDRNTFLLTR